MNVSQISGDNANPNIWQFFVATIGVNLVIILVLMLAHFFSEISRNKRRPSAMEVFKFAIGNKS